MAIKTIDELNEIQLAGQNDSLLISTPDGARKIKASAISGGGGESTVEIIEIDYNGGALRTVLTAGEIKAIIESGKAIIGRAEVTDGMVVQLGLAVSHFAEGGNMMLIYTVDGSSGNLVAFILTAATESDVFTVSQ